MNIYAPTNVTERKRFFTEINEYFFPNAQLIVGDFNCIDNIKDKSGGNTSNISDSTSKIKTDFRLVDIWRRKNPPERLDKYLISKQLQPCVRNCQIFPCFFSDHDFVSLRLNMHGYYSHSPGMWCLNSSMLQDNSYCEKITSVINDHLLYEEAFPSKKELWDFLKSSIKEETIAYSKAKRKQLHHERVILTKKLIRARQQFTRGDQTAQKTIQMLENKLKALSRREMEGVKIKSRAKWLEGEKPTRFFFRREQSRIEKNQINSIFDKNDKEVTTKDEIEQAHLDFYTSLYSQEQTDPQIQADLLSEISTSLEEHDKELCEGELTLEELTAAVNSLAKHKTPGADGIPLEFYIKFWPVLSPLLLVVINESFRDKELSDSMKESITRLIFKKGDKRNLKNWRPI